MVRDLVQASVKLVKDEKMVLVKEDAEDLANERLIALLAPGLKGKRRRILEALMNQQGADDSEEEVTPEVRDKRRSLRSKLLNGYLEDEEVSK